ncbi:hypothetical protein [Shimazuella alba]|uniref:Uncharacterized protein n=1 Tax=Shimazuella alba TaxID=2690964 RepID=A0A6I4VYJ1_9BACL|nr:hypothetical protein [Shimazuella alba]MXQ55933.1 hypothetical protein [Shimazuella alba]
MNSKLFYILIALVLFFALLHSAGQGNVAIIMLSFFIAIGVIVWGVRMMPASWRRYQARRQDRKR